MEEAMAEWLKLVAHAERFEAWLDEHDKRIMMVADQEPDQCSEGDVLVLIAATKTQRALLQIRRQQRDIAQGVQAS
jgi:hypothetical protein